MPFKLQKWMKKGETLCRSGKYEEAIECFDKAIGLNSNHADAWFDKGYCLNNLGRYEEAIELFNKAIEIDPRFAPAWGGEGHAFFSLGMILPYFQFPVITIPPSVRLKNFNWYNIPNDTKRFWVKAKKELIEQIMQYEKDNPRIVL
jgi:superkiller protein 3